MPALLSVAATARVLACSPRTVRRRIAEGELPAVADHGRVMVRGDELAGYVERLERHGPAARRAPRRRAQQTDGFDFLRQPATER